MHCGIIVSILDYNFINKEDTFIFYFIHPHPWETHGSQSLGISTIDSAYFCKEGLCVKSTSSQYPKKYYIWPDYEIIHRVERFYKGINDNNIPDKNNDDLILNGQYKICRVNINERIFTDIEDLYCIDFNDDDEKISERLYIIKEGEKQSSLNDIFEVLPKRYLRSPSKTLYSYDSNRFYFKENFSLNEKRGCDIMLSNFFRLFDLHGFQKRDYMNKYNSDFETICDKIKRVIICNHVCIRHTNKFIRDYYSSLKFDFDIHEKEYKASNPYQIYDICCEKECNQDAANHRYRICDNMIRSYKRRYFKEVILLILYDMYEKSYLIRHPTIFQSLDEDLDSIIFEHYTGKVDEILF